MYEEVGERRKVGNTSGRRQADESSVVVQKDSPSELSIALLSVSTGSSRTVLDSVVVLATQGCLLFRHALLVGYLGLVHPASMRSARSIRKGDFLRVSPPHHQRVVNFSPALARFRMLNVRPVNRAPSPLPPDDVEEEMEEMLQEGPVGKEWGGPTRGGVLGEPTRFGDWERKGRCSDF